MATLCPFGKSTDDCFMMTADHQSLVRGKHASTLTVLFQVWRMPVYCLQEQYSMTSSKRRHCLASTLSMRRPTPPVSCLCRWACRQQ
jgi:hypothetical protein